MGGLILGAGFTVVWRCLCLADRSGCTIDKFFSG